MRRKLILFLLLILLIALLGCSRQETNQQITIKLTGLPSDNENYQVKIYVEGERKVKDIYSFDNIKASQELSKQIKVDKKTTSLMVYLFSSKQQKNPDYFQRLDYKPEKSKYETAYWLNYHKFKNYDEVRYGISKYLATPVETKLKEKVNFDEQPYGLYKVSNSKNYSINLELTIPEGDVYLNYGSEADSDFNYYTISSQNWSTTLSKEEKNTYILIRSSHYEEADSATVKINLVPQTRLEDKIFDLVAGDSPERVYAVTEGYYDNKIYYINPLTQSIEKKFSISLEEPVALDYSPADKKLYIVGSYSDKVVVWDVVNNKVVNTFENYTFDESCDVLVLPSMNRIYVLSQSGKLFVLKMDGEVLVSGLVGGDSMAAKVIDETQKKVRLFTTDYRADMNTNLWIHDVSDTQIVEEDSIPDAGYDVERLVSNPTQSQLLVPNSDNEICFYDTADYQQEDKKVTIGGNPESVTFSPDGSLLYGINENTDDKYLYVMDAEAGAQVRKIFFPQRSNSVICTSNSDGSVLIVYDDDYSDSAIYYLKNIKK